MAYITIEEPSHAEVDGIRVLHVDDEPDFAALVKEFLEREEGIAEVVSETGTQDGLARLRIDDIDCIVSDYDMPDQHGLAFLDAIRTVYPDVPFILFTGKGSEQIAGSAISRGVTEYLQKGGSPEQYNVLANRIRNSVKSYRTQHELERSRQFLDRVLDLSPAAVVVLDGEGGVVRANHHAESVLGLSAIDATAGTLFDTDWEFVDENEEPLPAEMLPFRRVRETGEPVHETNRGLRRPDGEVIWLSINAAPLWNANGDISNVIAILSEETRDNRQDRIRTKLDAHLEGFAHVLSHDLGNILNIAQGRLRLARESGDDDHFDAVEDSLIRAVDLLADLTHAIMAGTVVDEIEPVNVGSVFEEAWQTQAVETATRVVDADVLIHADRTALMRMFENLIRNTFEHGPDAETVRIGSIPDGFYVEDDGPGIPAAERGKVFEPGFTTKIGGTGIGLPSIQQIALAHGWETRIVDASGGGARFEFSNVEQVPD